jgi:hypothetical protein
MKLILLESAMTLAVIVSVHALDLGKSAPFASAAAAEAPAAPATLGAAGAEAPAIGNPEVALRDYINGSRSFTPDQMTDLLNNTTRYNPNLDMNGAIAKTFNNLARTRGQSEASKFLQALGPSYDNVRAAAIAAITQGNARAATQLASQMDNLIPGGVNTNFAVEQDGNIVATVHDPRGKTLGYSMTPQQFAQYLTNPQFSKFDPNATIGMDQIMQQLGARSLGARQEPATTPAGRTIGYATLGPAPYAQGQARAATGIIPDQGYYDANGGYHKTQDARLGSVRYMPMTPGVAAGGGTPEETACKRYPNLC